jgi:hypothetical protein
MWTVAEIFKYMAIASQLSSMPMADNIPFVFMDKDAEIQKQVCAYNHDHCTPAYAFMYGPTGEIHIGDELDSYSKETILVHELTHWLQWKAKVNQSDAEACQNEHLALRTEAQYSLKYEHKQIQIGLVPCDFTE